MRPLINRGPPHKGVAALTIVVIALVTAPRWVSANCIDTQESSLVGIKTMASKNTTTLSVITYGGMYREFDQDLIPSYNL
jgi:hypothetical protein